MNDTDITPYLDKLLKVYEEKTKRFRLSLALLLVGTTVFFLLIFFPYMTLLGNQEECRVNQYQCTELEQSQLEDRFSEFTTAWGNIPVSTAEVVIFFPVGIAGGFVSVASQFQGLVRLRRAIAQQVKIFKNSIDITLIAPLLIDPKRGFLDQLAGGVTFSCPFIIFLYSINIILFRIEVLRNKLPYFQVSQFYYSIYFLSLILIVYNLVRTGFFLYKKDINKSR